LIRCGAVCHDFQRGAHCKSIELHAARNHCKHLPTDLGVSAFNKPSTFSAIFDR